MLRLSLKDVIIMRGVFWFKQPYLAIIINYFLFKDPLRRITICSALNVDFKELGDYLGDPVITTAIVDRMVHHSIIINIDGPSWRMHCSKQINR